MAYVYSNLKDHQNKESGIAEFMLIAPASDFAEGGIKAPAAPFTNPGDEVKVLQQHEFLAGKAFAKIVLAPEKNQMNAKSIGDNGFTKLDFEIDAFIPGSYAEAHEAVKNWLNTPCIFMFKDANCPANMWYQIGNDCTQGYLKADFSTGTTKDGVKGYAAKITWQNGYVQLYAHIDGPEVYP